MRNDNTKLKYRRQFKANKLLTTNNANVVNKQITEGVQTTLVPNLAFIRIPACSTILNLSFRAAGVGYGIIRGFIEESIPVSLVLDSTAIEILLNQIPGISVHSLICVMFQSIPQITIDVVSQIPF